MKRQNLLLYRLSGFDDISELRPPRACCSSPDHIWAWSHGRIILTRKTEELEKKTYLRATTN
jgi:hypothetical protein